MILSDKWVSSLYLPACFPREEAFDWALESVHRLLYWKNWADLSLYAGTKIQARTLNLAFQAAGIPESAAESACQNQAGLQKTWTED